MKKGKIDEILRKIAENTSKASTQTSSNTEQPKNSGLPGDPECPICGGVGYLRLNVPVGHPEFGKVQVCSCRNEQISQQVRQRLFNLSQLDELRHLRFENFNPQGKPGYFPVYGNSLEKAFNQSQLYAHKLEGWLLLQGRFGCGKTHLAAAIANYAVEMGVPTLFITVPDMLDSLRFSYGQEQGAFEQRFDEIRTAPLLVLDDFGTQNATSWATEKLFQILNYRYINRLPLVVTTNLQIDQIEERIRSRLQDPALVTRVPMIAPDYRDPYGDEGHPELSSLHLHNQHTFARFSDRRDEGLKKEELQSLEKAFRAAREFAEAPRGWLVFTGSYATGKTHLAAAIANMHSEVDLPPLFVVVPDLLDHLRATFSPETTVSLDRRFDEVRQRRLLILDDLGVQSTTPWAREKLYQLFNYRYNAELPTVITTSLSIETLGQAEPRLLSRMLDRRLCKIYAIDVPPYRGTPEDLPARRRKSRGM